LDQSFQHVKRGLKVSGKPQFDEAAVISAAVRVFWSHGYAATSISDLTEATGLSRSSLYQRFGDKDGLFREAFQAYTDRVLQRMNSATADTARGRLATLLRAYLPDSSIPRPPGCLIARSCSEMAELSPAGKAAVLGSAEDQRQVLAGILHEGAQKGELSQDANIEALAWHYLGVLQAVLNFPQVGADRDTLNGMIDMALSAWPTGDATS
jgi:TetR/AcrR family transcriptional regulator, copper-responsive repressor